MINLYGYSLEIYQAVLAFYVIGYGLTLGLRNTVLRIYALFSMRECNQSGVGIFLDGLWYAASVFLIGSWV